MQEFIVKWANFSYYEEVSISKIIWHSIFACTIILPFLYLPTVPNSYERPKFYFLICTMGITGLLLVREIVFNKISIAKIQKPLPFVLMVFIYWTAFTNIIGLDLKTSFLGSEVRHQGFLTLVAGFLLFLCISLYGTLERREKLVKGLGASSVVISAVALWQFCATEFLKNTDIILFQDRIITTFGNPNFLGGYLATILPLVLFSRRFSNQKKAVICSVIILAVLSTASRSAYIAIGFTAAFWLVSRIKQKTARGFFYVFIVLLAFLGTLQIIQSRSSYWDNREIIYKYAVEKSINYPFIGIGQENFALVFPENLHYNVDDPHNIFLNIALSSGFIGLGLFITGLSLALKSGSFQMRVALISFLITAQFNPLSIPQIVLFWTILGLVRAQNKGR